VNSESISDVRRILNDNNVVLKKMVDQSQALKSARAASTIGGQDIEFDFDEQIVNSLAYRRAFRTFVKKSKPELPKEGEPSKDTDDKLTLIQESTVSTWTSDDETTAKDKEISIVGPDIKPAPGSSPSSQPPARKPVAARSTPREDNSNNRAVASSPITSVPEDRRAPEDKPGLPILTKAAEDGPKKQSDGDPELNELLRTAAEKGHVPLVKMLVRKGADVNAADKDKNRPIHKATRKAKGEVVEVLLENGADPEVKGQNENRALNLACISGDMVAVKALLDFGVDIEGDGNLGWHPMHHAAGNDYPEVLKYLVEHGANKECLAENGDRPLHSAAQWGRMNAAEALLNMGVDMESKNNPGNRPLNLACIAGKLEMVKFLVRRGAELEGPGCM
jgi:ankyrin repeat protein